MSKNKKIEKTLTAIHKIANKKNRLRKQDFR